MSGAARTISAQVPVTHAQAFLLGAFLGVGWLRPKGIHIFSILYVARYFSKVIVSVKSFLCPIYSLTLVDIVRFLILALLLGG